MSTPFELGKDGVRGGRYSGGEGVGKKKERKKNTETIGRGARVDAFVARMRRGMVASAPMANLVQHLPSDLDARRLRLPEAAQIETIVRELGENPEALPFAGI